MNTQTESLMLELRTVHKQDGKIQEYQAKFDNAWRQLRTLVFTTGDELVIVIELQKFYSKYKQYIIFLKEKEYVDYNDEGEEDEEDDEDNYENCLDMNTFISLLFFIATVRLLLDPWGRAAYTFVRTILRFQIDKRLTPGVNADIYANEFLNADDSMHLVEQSKFDAYYAKFLKRFKDEFHNAIANANPSSCSPSSGAGGAGGDTAVAAAPATSGVAPKLIGQGSYGCVYYPSFMCKSLEGSEYVAKVMTKEEGEKEQASMKTIRDIDSKGDYHWKLLDTCEVPRNLDLSGCKVRELTIHNAMMLIYPYGGGEFEQITRGTVKMSIAVLSAFENVFDAIVLFERKNFVHGDVKPPNVLFTKVSLPKGGSKVVLKLNDFGISFTYNDARAWRRGSRAYPYYPMYILILDAVKQKYINNDAIWNEKVREFAVNWCVNTARVGINSGVEDVVALLNKMREEFITTDNPERVKIVKWIFSRIDLFGAGVCLRLARQHLEGRIVEIKDEYDKFVRQLILCKLSPVEARRQCNDLMTLALKGSRDKPTDERALRGVDALTLTGVKGGKGVKGEPSFPARVLLPGGVRSRPSLSIRALNVSNALPDASTLRALSEDELGKMGFSREKSAQLLEHVRKYHQNRDMVAAQRVQRFIRRRKVKRQDAPASDGPSGGHGPGRYGPVGIGYGPVGGYGLGGYGIGAAGGAGGGYRSRWRKKSRSQGKRKRKHNSRR